MSSPEVKQTVINGTEMDHVMYFMEALVQFDRPFEELTLPEAVSVVHAAALGNYALHGRGFDFKDKTTGITVINPRYDGIEPAERFLDKWKDWMLSEHNEGKLIVNIVKDKTFLDTLLRREPKVISHTFEAK